MGRILERLLEVEGIRCNLLFWRILLAEKLNRLKELQPRYILLSATDPRSTAAVGKMAESLRGLLPDATILVGLWNLPPSGAARLFRKIKESAASDIYTNLDQAVRGIASQISSAAEGSRPKSPWAQ